MMDDRHKCTLDECNNECSIFREFCSKECKLKFFEKYPQLRRNDKNESLD